MHKKFCIAVLSLMLMIGLTGIFGFLPQESEAAGMADSPWPGLGYDSHHTGRSPVDVGEVDGGVRWETIIQGDFGTGSPAVGPDGTIYIGFEFMGRFMAMNPDGTKKWHYTTGEPIHTTPAVGEDGTVYFGSDNGNLYALNPDGTRKWIVNTQYRIRSSPTIGDDGTIYIGSGDENLYAVNPDGSIKWQFSVGTNVGSSPAVGYDGTVYFGSDGGVLYAVNPNGDEVWSFDAGDTIRSSPMVSPGGTVYFGSNNGKLYALDLEGEEKWNISTGDPIYTTPALGSDGTVYVTSEDNILHAVDSDGTEKWSVQAIGNPVIGGSGTIYTGDKAVNLNGTVKFYIGGFATIIGDETTLYNFHNYDEGGTVRAIGDAPSAPRNLEVDAGDGKVKLNWDGPQDTGESSIIEYKIYRGTEGVISTIDSVEGNNRSYIDNGLSNGETYDYKVSAVNTAGEGGLSEVVSATPTAEEEGIPFIMYVGLVLVVLVIVFIYIYMRKKKET